MQNIKFIMQPKLRQITGSIIVSMDIPGYIGLYKATSDGQIISLLGKEPKTLKPGKNEKGYLHVVLYKNGKKHNIKVHKLICLTFIGDRPKNMTINHKNGNKLDNKPSNLEYITQRQNCTHYTSNKKTSSQYTGVCWNNIMQKWEANISINNKKYYLGCFEQEIEANNAYQNA